MQTSLPESDDDSDDDDDECFRLLPGVTLLMFLSLKVTSSSPSELL